MSSTAQLSRVRVGVVGCGLVAQVMHLPYLRELDDRFDVVFLCDLSQEALAFASRLFPDAARSTDWHDLLAPGSCDAVLVLTPGSHAPIALAAAEAGLHAFVEKPFSLSVAEGLEVVEAAERAGTRLMVGYMKRFDPAFERLERELPRAGLRLARITTLESPLEPYVEHLPLVRPVDVDPAVLAELAADDDRRVSAAIATDDPPLRRAYRSILLDSMVHDLNAVRALLGEPDELRFADVWGEPDGVLAALAFGDAECVVLWVDLPGIAHYEQEWSFFAPDRRATLRLPSPFLRSAPSVLELEGGEAGTPSAWRAEHVVAYDEAFKRELVEFHACIVERREPRTGARDALRDVALCTSIVRCIVERRPVPSPSDPELHASRALH